MAVEPRTDPVTGELYIDREPFAPAREDPLLQRAVPVTRDVRRYRPDSARRDLTAGLTVAALAVPSAMAYAELAGVSAVHGLYTILLPCLAYTLLGSSRQMVVGPGGSLSAMVAAAILPLAAPNSPQAAELAAMIALLSGALYLTAGALRVGWFADYLSRPVLVGYIHGVVIVVMISQLGRLFGLDISAHDAIPTLVETGREFTDANAATTILSLVLLAVLIPLAYRAPRLPAALLAMIAAIAASRWLDLPAHGVAVVGDIPSGLPAIQLPRVSLSDISLIAPAALGVFLISAADEALIARTFAGRHAQSVRINQELVAMSVANLAAAVSQGVPVGASESRTAVNDTMGARSQVAGLWAIAAVVLVLLFLTGPIADLPSAVLGVVIVAALLGLIHPQAWRELWATDRVEVTIAAVTAAGVVVVGIVEGVAFAVGLAIVDVVRRSAHPHDAVLGWLDDQKRWADVALHPSARVTPGVVVYHLDDRLFFANADYVKGRVFEALRAAPTQTRCVVFDAISVTHIDTAGLDALADLARRLDRAGIELRIAAVKDYLVHGFEVAGVTEKIPREHFYPTVGAAMREAPAVA